MEHFSEFQKRRATKIWPLPPPPQVGLAQGGRGDHSSQTEGGWIYGCGDEICPRPLTHFDSISLADEWMDGSELLLS